MGGGINLPMKTTIDDLADHLLQRHYFVGTDGMLYTPSDKAAYRVVREGRRDLPTTVVVAALQRKARRHI
jgi:hypothetical protein